MINFLVSYALELRLSFRRIDALFFRQSHLPLFFNPNPPTFCEKECHLTSQIKYFFLHTESKLRKFNTNDNNRDYKKLIILEQSLKSIYPNHSYRLRDLNLGTDHAPDTD